MVEHGFTSEDVEAMEIETATLGLKTASIGEPKSGLDCKFSFSQVGAFVLSGIDTAADETYSDSILSNQQVNRVRPRVATVENTEINPLETIVRVTLKNGEVLERYFNYQESMADLGNIKPGLESKFNVTAGSVLSDEKVAALKDLVMSIETLEQGVRGD